MKTLKRMLATAVVALVLMPFAAQANESDGGCVPPAVKPTAVQTSTKAAAEEGLTGPRARTVAGALMRGSPVQNTADGQMVPTGTAVRLVSPLKNTQGSWWFVTARGVGGGWLRDVELYDYAR